MKVRVLVYGCLFVSICDFAMQMPQSLPVPTLTKTVPIMLPSSVILSPDGAKAIISTSEGGQASAGQVLIYDSGLNTQLHKFEFPNQVTVADISPDSQTMCLINESTSAQLVSIANGKVVATLPAQSVRAATIQYDEHGQRLLIASPNGVYLYDMGSSKVINVISEYSQSRVAYFNPANNDLIAVAQELGNNPETGVQLWDVKGAKATHTFKPKPEPVYQLAFNSTGDKLACGQVSYLSVWDARSGQETELINGAGKLVTKPTTKKWGAAQIIKFIPGKNIFFAPINSLEENGAILACDIDTPANNIRFGQIGENMSKCVTSIAVSPDGKTLLAARELSNDISVWNEATVSRHVPNFCELL